MTRVSNKLTAALFAEAFGVFLLTFTDGCLGIFHLADEPIPLINRAIAPALVIMTMIFSFGEISGAHINPIATAAFVARGVFPKGRAIKYILAQILGATLAGALLALLFGDDVFLATTKPQDSVSLAAVFELLMSMFLVTTILSTATNSRIKGAEAAFPIGFTLTVCGLLAKELSGASMNPARSLGTALVSLQFEDIWIYLTMPFIGAALAVVITWITKGGPSPEEKKAACGD